MTKTDVKLSELRRSVPHLKECSEEGWVLSWGDSAEPPFELICKGTSLAQVEKMDHTITKAYQDAAVKFLS